MSVLSPMSLQRSVPAFHCENKLERKKKQDEKKKHLGKNEYYGMQTSYYFTTCTCTYLLSHLLTNIIDQPSAPS